MRVRQRYLIAQLMSSDEEPADISILTPQDILIALRECLQTLYGDVGTGVFSSSMVVKYLDKDARRRLLVLRVGRSSLHPVWLALSCIQSIRRFTCTIRVLNVAGSHRTCKEKLLLLTRGCFDNEDKESDFDNCSRRIQEVFKDP